MAKHSRARLCLLVLLDDEATHADFISSFPIKDAAHLATSCRRLRSVHLSLLLRDGEFDFIRLREDHRVSPKFFRGAMAHVRILLSIKSLSASHSDGGGAREGELAMVTDLQHRVHAAEDTVAMLRSRLSRANLLVAQLESGRATYPTLTSIRVIECPNVTDDFLKALTKNYPLLTKLDIAYCKRLQMLASRPLRRGAIASYYFML